MKYKKTARSRPFQPVQAINYTQGLQEEEARQRNSRNLNEQIAGENYQTAKENAGRVPNVDDTFDRNLKALSSFSNTLAETLVEQQKKENEKEQARGLNEAFMDSMNGVPDPNAESFDVGEAALRETDALIDETAIEIQQQGAGYGPAEKLREMSGWRAYGYAMGMAKLAGSDYAPYLEEQMARNDLNFTDPTTGAPFTPMTAKGSQRLQAISQIREAYISERGLTKLNNSLVNKYAFPSMIQAESEFNSVESRRELQAARDNAELEAKTIFDGDQDLNGLIRRIAASNGGNYKKALDTAFDHLKAAQQGDVVNNLEPIKTQPDPRNPGQTLGYTFRTRFGQLEAELAATNIAEYNRSNRIQLQQFEEEERRILDSVSADPTSINTTELEELQDKLSVLHPNRQRSRELDDLITRKGFTASLKREQKNLLDNARRNNTLTVEDVKKSHVDFWATYLPIAEAIEKANSEAPPAKDITAIEGTVRKIVGNLNPDLPLSIDARFVVNRLTNIYNQERGRQLAMKVSPAEASERALLYAKMEFERQQDVGQEFYYDPKNGFSKINEKIYSGLTEGRAAFDRKVAKAEAAEAVKGDKFLDDAEILLSEPELIKMEADFNKPSFQPPAIVRYYAEKLNKNPLDIINRQRGAIGLDPLVPPAYIEEQGLDDDVKQLLRQFPSPVRTARAWGQSGKFNESIVPLQLGPMIAEKSAQYGVDPAIVAGIIEAENSGMDGSVNWRNDATSHAGAMGIAQFMPGTAADLGVDPWNIESAVDGAVRYVKHIQDQWAAEGVILTPEQIAMMYNAGPNHPLDAYPYGEENRGYRTKFLRGFQKYGGGQGYWNSPQSMRQTFAEQLP